MGGLVFENGQVGLVAPWVSPTRLEAGLAGKKFNGFWPTLGGAAVSGGVSTKSALIIIGLSNNIV